MWSLSIGEKENTVWYEFGRIYDLDLDKYPEHIHIMNDEELNEYRIKYDDHLHKNRKKYYNKIKNNYYNIWFQLFKII